MRSLLLGTASEHDELEDPVRKNESFERFLAVLMVRVGQRHNLGLCREVLGGKFAGVYSSDQRPALSKKNPYAILNAKPTSSGSEHGWGLHVCPRLAKSCITIHLDDRNDNCFQVGLRTQLTRNSMWSGMRG